MCVCVGGGGLEKTLFFQHLRAPPLPPSHFTQGLTQLTWQVHIGLLPDPRDTGQFFVGWGSVQVVRTHAG